MFLESTSCIPDVSKRYTSQIGMLTRIAYITFVIADESKVIDTVGSIQLLCKDIKDLNSSPLSDKV